MPTFPSAEAFARELDKLDRTLNKELRNATREMAERAEKIAVQEASRDLGGNSTFDGGYGRGSGWPGRDLADLRIKRGRREGINDTSHWLFPTRKSGGPWKVAERGRNQGNAVGRGGSAIFIGPSIDQGTGETFRTKTGRVRMTRRRRSGRWNGYTRGKGTASRAAAQFDRAAQPIADKKFRTALSKHFSVS